MKSDHILMLASGGFRRIHITEWGDANNDRVLVCAHGLTRNGRDFDEVAKALQDQYRVVCPDMPGRGQSDWLRDKTEYSYPTYLNVVTALLARIHVDAIDWLGTSMGGLIGMLVAAQANSPIRRLVVNDVGPYIPVAAMQRIAGYVGLDPRFKDLEELEHYLRKIHAPFGHLSDAQWRHLAVHTAKELPDGKLALRHDPGIAVPFEHASDTPVQLWETWDAIRCPVTVLRGQSSDVLLDDTVQEMKQRGSKPDVIEFPDVGHAPALMDELQVNTVRDLLLSED